MNNSLKVDENGHIIIDESMSDELKAKIMSYNSYCNGGEDEDRELSDEEVDAFQDDYVEGFEDEDDDESSNNDIEEVAADQETLNSLNDIFM